MSLAFSVNFGSPNKNQVQYDKNSKRLITVFGDGAAKNYCTLYSPESGLRLFADAAEGNIIGLEAFIGEIDSLPELNFTEPDFTDGCICVSWDCGNLIAECNYLIDFNCTFSYDSAKKVLACGDYFNGCITVRICENVYLAVNSSNKLCGLIIKL